MVLGIQCCDRFGAASGTDVSEDHTMHSKFARKLWKTMAIGKLTKCDGSDAQTHGKGDKPWSLLRW